MDDVAVALEHVNLLDSLDGLDVDLLQGLLKLLVIGTGPSGSSLDLSPGSALATVIICQASESKLGILGVVGRSRRGVGGYIPCEDGSSG